VRAVAFAGAVFALARLRYFAGTLAALGLAGALAGCREQVSEDPPITVQRNMFDQERYNPESYSTFYGDHRTMREPPEGTLARERYEPDESVATGLLADGTGYVMTIPQPAIARAGGMEKLVARGQERFNIYCAPCHSQTGDGKGMVARVPNGFPPIPSYTDPRIKQMPDGQLFATISNGVRNMPSYAAQVPIQDRWAIVAYVRALELSQVAQAAPPPQEPKK
jgi:mono/diheme cytochrome c family protein